MQNLKSLKVILHLFNVKTSKIGKHIRQTRCLRNTYFRVATKELNVLEKISGSKFDKHWGYYSWGFEYGVGGGNGGLQFISTP